MLLTKLHDPNVQSRLCIVVALESFHREWSRMEESFILLRRAQLQQEEMLAGALSSLWPTLGLIVVAAYSVRRFGVR